MTKHYKILCLCLCFISGCTFTQKKDIPLPPEIQTVYYEDPEFGCIYVSIESDITPLFTKEGYPLCNKGSFSKSTKNTRIKTLTVEGLNCDFVLAYYSNGKTKRLKPSGESVCLELKID